MQPVVSGTQDIPQLVGGLQTEASVPSRPKAKMLPRTSGSVGQHRDAGTILVVGKRPIDADIELAGTGSADLAKAVDVSSDDGNELPPPPHKIFPITGNSLTLLQNHQEWLDDEIIFTMPQFLQQSSDGMGVVHPIALNRDLSYVPTIGLRKTMIPIHVNSNH